MIQSLYIGLMMSRFTSFSVPQLSKFRNELLLSMWMQEFGKHDKEPAKYIKQWKGNNSKTGAPFSCDVGYERFLAPEVGTSIP